MYEDSSCSIFTLTLISVRGVLKFSHSNRYVPEFPHCLNGEPLLMLFANSIFSSCFLWGVCFLVHFERSLDILDINSLSDM